MGRTRRPTVRLQNLGRAAGTEPTQTRTQRGLCTHSDAERTVLERNRSSRSLDFSSCRGGHPPGWGTPAAERSELQFPASATRGHCSLPPAAVALLEVPRPRAPPARGRCAMAGGRRARDQPLPVAVLQHPAVPRRGLLIASSLSGAAPTRWTRSWTAPPLRRQCPRTWRTRAVSGNGVSRPRRTRTRTCRPPRAPPVLSRRARRLGCSLTRRRAARGCARAPPASWPRPAPGAVWPPCPHRRR